MQDDDDASARLQKVNEAFEDAAPLRNVLLAVCREFGLAHAARRLEPSSAAGPAVSRDADMPDAGSAGAEGTSAEDNNGDEADESQEESDGNEEDDDIWSAAERDDKDMMVSHSSSHRRASHACVHP